MDEIRPWLFIGRYQDTLQLGHLRLKSIHTLLQLARKVDQPGIESFYLPFEDFAPLNFELPVEGLAFIREQKGLGNRVLIACGAGINRSCTICIAALKKEEGLSLLGAFKDVKKKHPESMPH